MSDITKNLKAFLEDDATVQRFASTRIYDDHIPQANGDSTLPYVWMGVRQETQHGTLGDANGSSAVDEYIVDLEVGAGRQHSQRSLASAVASRLRDYRGTFGDTTTKGIILRDKDNEYVYQTGDEGVFVSAFDVQVWL
jgi:hypothetical protein